MDNNFLFLPQKFTKEKRKGAKNTDDSSFFSDDPYEVHVSNDLSSWHYLGDGLGDTAFDINGALPQARYVKLVGMTPNAEINVLPNFDE